MNVRIGTLFVLALCVTAQGKEWNQFRGPGGDGKSKQSVPVEFSESQNVRWKSAIPGEGWSSPVVWENQIWLTTGIEKAMHAICIDVKSGQVIHNKKIFDEIKVPRIAGYAFRSPHLNSPASPTPVVEKGRVYVHFGAQGTACLDTKSGKILWQRRDLHCDHIVRPGSSPIVDEDSLYIAFDGADKQFFVALNKNTGKTRWRQDRNVKSDWEKTLRARGIDPGNIKKEKPGDHKKSYATAHIIEHAGRRQLIAPAAEATISYDPQTGKELWRVHHFGGFNVSARPLYAHGLVYVYTSGLNGILLAIRPNGSGDVTKSHVAWRTMRGTPHIPCPVIVGDLMFLVTTKGIARCLNAKTGEQVWQKRLGGNHWASPLLANGKLYFSNKDGEVTILTAARKSKTLAKNQLQASFVASPAIVGNSLLLRSTTHLYRIEKGFRRTAAQVAADTKPIPKKKAFAKKGFAKKSGKGKGQSNNKNLAALGRRLKQLVVQKKLTAKEAIGLYRLAAAAAGEGNVKIGKGKRGKNPQKGGKGKGKNGFYAIVIGRLQSKDIELGEFTLKVDHVTSMYGNRWVKDEIVGKTVKVTGVSGRFRDNLLLIRKGQTLKFRSGTYDAETKTVTFGFKFHVLERAKPFTPEAYGIPPKSFRGFSGELQGKIVEVGGFEAVIRVSKVVSESSASSAKKASTIKGKLVRMVGFYRFEKAFNTLRKGDDIRIAVRHANAKHDEFQVSKAPEQVKK